MKDEPMKTIISFCLFNSFRDKKKKPLTSVEWGSVIQYLLTFNLWND